jgi:cell wall-associated NlpC family hydrolase
VSGDATVTPPAGPANDGDGRRCATRPPARFAAALTGALLVPAVLLGSQPALARPVPTPPSAGQVQQAKSAAGAKAAQVKAAQAALIAASARLDAARTAAEQAAEAYNGARIKLAAADQAARLARANAAHAAVSYVQARVDVGRLAAQVYRDGGNLSEVSVVLLPGGPQDVLDRAALIDTLGAERSRVLQRMDATRVVANLLEQQADDALSRQKAATAALATARDRATSTADTAAAAVAATQAEQARLLAELAALQHTSVALEQQRQAVLAEAAAHRSTGGTGGSGGSAAGGSGGSAAGGSGSGGSAAGGSGSGGSGSGGSGSGGSGPAPSGSSQGGSTAGDTAVAWAKQQLGLPYRWGGAGPDSYDCSGLTMQAWQHAGVSLPHYAASQYDRSEKVPYSRMQPGDLIFYATDTSNPASIHHVAMYVGGGMMIEAPYTGADIRIVPVRWNRTMPMAGRP